MLMSKRKSLEHFPFSNTLKTACRVNKVAELVCRETVVLRGGEWNEHLVLSVIRLFRHRKETFRPTSKGWLETSVLESLYGGEITLSTLLIKPNISVKQVPQKAFALGGRL